MSEFQAAADGPRPDRAALGWVVLAACLAYGVSLFGAFVYDDVHSVRDNVALRSLANIPRFFVDVELFSSLDCRLYRPVLLTSFAVDAWIAGVAPWMFKLTNLILHSAAAGLIFALGRRLGFTRFAALLSGVLFAVHPLASEAVNTISGRSNVMMVVAVLAAMYAHLAAIDGRRGAAWLTPIGAAVAVGCKEPGMILPVLLVILEALRCSSVDRSTVLAAVGRITPTAVVVLAYFSIRGHFLGEVTAGMNNWQATDVSSGAGRGMATQLASMALVLPRALGQVLVPVGLTMDPVVPFDAKLTDPSVWASGGLIVLFVAAGLSGPRRRPGVFLGTCLMCGMAAPWVLKPLNLPFLEHRFYGCLAGLALVAGGLLTLRSKAVTCAAPAASRSWGWAWGAAAAVVVSFVALSVARSLDFRSERLLWEVELRQNPQSRVAMAGMAVCRMQAGDDAGARPLLEKIVEAYPYRRDARLNLAEVSLRLGDAGQARAQAEFLLEHWPNNPFYCLLHSRTLAAVAKQRGDEGLFDAAVAAALRANEVATPKGLVYRTAASARRLQGDLGGAIELLDRAVAAGLNHSSVLLDRFELLRRVGRQEDAARDLRAARLQSPFDPRVLAAMPR